ncbi:hypothetical protein SAMN05444159_3461 [Bradyrhizobium lablabi]|jgi:hypothetical protein|uniref:Sulfur globule protein n=1 Tax=Bradyrhizobium lablabi TaxID=722472 RepID=A0A1M6T455_9BRAD|nr:hypothetical protein SAMN05444159_3461 [Bradyrhizobium lablabi]
MLRNAINVLAIVLVLGSSGFSTSAFARGGGFGGGSDGFRGNHFGGVVADSPGDGHGGYDSRAHGLPGRSHPYGGRDVWGHWGAYYGPMVPAL